MEEDSRSSHALAFFDNLCGSVVGDDTLPNYSSSNHSSKDKKRDSSSRSSKTKSSSAADSAEDNRHVRNNANARHSSSSASRKYSLSHGSGGRRPRTSYDDDTESEIAESEVDGMDEEQDNDDNDDNDDEDDEAISTNHEEDDDEETDADTMVTDVSELTPAAAAATTNISGSLLTSSSTNSNGGTSHPMTHHHHHNAKPLASSFAKKCYFTKAGIGKMTQHYEGLVHNGGPTVLMLASAMKLKGCPTICDEDLRRVEQSYPNLFSRLPDELMLSSGWRRISKYCHFSNRSIPDGIPFFRKYKTHTKETEQHSWFSPEISKIYINISKLFQLFLSVFFCVPYFKYLTIIFFFLPFFSPNRFQAKDTSQWRILFSIGIGSWDDESIGSGAIITGSLSCP